MLPPSLIIARCQRTLGSLPDISSHRFRHEILQGLVVDSVAGPLRTGLTLEELPELHFVCLQVDQKSHYTHAGDEYGNGGCKMFCRSLSAYQVVMCFPEMLSGARAPRFATAYGFRFEKSGSNLNDAGSVSQLLAQCARNHSAINFRLCS